MSQPYDALDGTPTGRGLKVGRFVISLGTAARTDIASRGEVNAYIDGATIILQIYDNEAGAWRTATFS